MSWNCLTSNISVQDENMSCSSHPWLSYQKIPGDSVQVNINCEWTGELRNIVYLVNVNIIFTASYNVILMIAVTFPLCPPRLAPATGEMAK